MWSPYCQVVLYSHPMYFPAQQAIPFNFPIVEGYMVDSRQNTQTKNHEELKNICVPTRSEQEQFKIQEQEISQEKLLQNTSDQLLKLIKLVLSKIHVDSKSLEKEICQQFLVSKILGKQFIMNFIVKLKKLSKTKQQTIKYCMRKAFKFANLKLRNQTHLQPEDEILKELIFGMNQGHSQNIPFKRHSHFKTMNSNFLSKVFSSPKFVELYKQFLETFQNMCQQDNTKKIENLVTTMIVHLQVNNNDFKRFNNFKRIPWPRHVIQRCIQVANDLLKYAPKPNKRNVTLQ